MAVSNLISVLNIFLTVAAILAAPIVALWIGLRLQKRSSRESAKLQLFSTLIATRHDALASDAIRSLNLIDLVFAHDLPVREAWSRYYAALMDQNLNIPVGYTIREERRRDLLLAMIEAMDLSERISSADLLRTYVPTLVGEQAYIGLLERTAKIAALREELKNRGLPDPAPGFVSPSAPAMPAPTGPIAAQRAAQSFGDGSAHSVGRTEDSRRPD
jgi:hypothetical protein